ncbi:MAG: inositol monophosphatase [Planctomycetota bacterium]
MIDRPTREALIAAVREAAQIEIVPRFRALPDGTVRSKSAPDDLVTDADTGMEHRLSARVADILPDALILGEEAASEDPSVLDRAATPGSCVIIDPVDGTWNFASGISTFGTILAVTEGGETTFGLLYDPLQDDWIEATRGEGASFNRPGLPAQALQVAPPETLPNMTGFIGLPLFPKDKQSDIALGFPALRRVLGLRCSCHEYRTLAMGRVSFNVNGMLKPWDHAAGALVVEEAGGVARMLDGRPYAPTLHEGCMIAASDDATWSAVADHFGPRILGRI